MYILIQFYRVQDKLDEAVAKFEADQKYLQKCYQEYEKQLLVHDTGVQEGYERTDLTIAVRFLFSCELKTKSPNLKLKYIAYFFNFCIDIVL